MKIFLLHEMLSSSIGDPAYYVDSTPSYFDGVRYSVSKRNEYLYRAANEIVSGIVAQTIMLPQAHRSAVLNIQLGDLLQVDTFTNKGRADLVIEPNMVKIPASKRVTMPLALAGRMVDASTGAIIVGSDIEYKDIPVLDTASFMQRMGVFVVQEPVATLSFKDGADNICMTGTGIRRWVRAGHDCILNMNFIYIRAINNIVEEFKVSTDRSAFFNSTFIFPERLVPDLIQGATKLAKFDEFETFERERGDEQNR